MILELFLEPSQLWPGAPFSLLKLIFCFLCFECRFGRLQVGLKRIQEVPKRSQERPKSAPRGSKRPPRAPHEAPREPQKIPRAGQEGSRPSKIAPRGSKRHRRRLRSPKSTYPKGLAANRRMKKRRAGGGDPPWGSQSAARPVGAEPSVLDRKPNA